VTVSLANYTTDTINRTTIYTLPAGWRPLGFVSNTTGDSDGKRRLLVGSGGNVEVEGGTAYYGGITFVTAG
jgi:hypothetical protein